MKRRIRKSDGIRRTGQVKGESDRWQLLADAIILKAVSDFRSFSRMMKRIRKQLKSSRLSTEEKDFQIGRLRFYESKLEDDKDFFFTDWFSTLTSLDGYELLSKLEEEVSH